jgi:tetratricopeptide (TPR) repeat protein
MNDELLWIEIGNLYLKLGAAEDAIASYARVIELNPQSGWAYCNLAYAYQRKGDLGKAVALYRKCLPMIEDEKQLATAWSRLGDTYRSMNDLENARSAYQMASDLEMVFGDPAAKKVEARTPRTTAATASIEAQTVESVAPAVPPPSPEPLQAEAQPAAQPPQESVPDLAAAPQLVSSRQGENSLVDRFILLTRETYRRSMLSEQVILPADQQPTPVEPIAAASPARSLEAALPPSLRVLDHQPEIVAESRSGEKENPDPALEEILAKVHVYENITRSNPANDRAWDTLGKLYKSLGRFKDAIDAYQQAITSDPNQEAYYYYLGLLYEVEKQHDHAIEAFLAVLQINPEYVLAHGALAGIYRRIGMDAKASQHINIALPKMDRESSYNRACFYSICGDMDLAFEFLELALINNDTTVEWILADPDLDQLRADPRFQKLLDEYSTHPPLEKNCLSGSLNTENNRMLQLLNESMVR